MKRREFVGLIGAAAAWPLRARAQERDRVRRIGVIMNYAENDSEGQARFSALRDRLHKLGWAEGSNIQIEVRWAAGKTDRMQAYAAELVRLSADVIVVNSTPLLAVLRPLPASEHPHRVRHSQSGHLVERGAFDGGLDPLIVEGPRPELSSEHGLELEHRIFSQTLPGAAARDSPTIP